MVYQLVTKRLSSTGKSLVGPDEKKAVFHEKLLNYLFLCFAYELKQDREELIYQEPVWSDPETTFSIVMYRSGFESFDYCCECIKALGGRFERECGPVTTVYTESQQERNRLKQDFLRLLAAAEKQLAGLNGVTPREFHAIKTHPVITEVSSTNNLHFIMLHAEILNSVDRLVWDELLKPWRDDNRIRDYYEIECFADGTAEIKMVFYRLRKQKKFFRYLINLGVQQGSRKRSITQRKSDTGL